MNNEFKDPLSIIPPYVFRTACCIVHLPQWKILDMDELEKAMNFLLPIYYQREVFNALRAACHKHSRKIADMASCGSRSYPISHDPELEELLSELMIWLTAQALVKVNNISNMQHLTETIRSLTEKVRDYSKSLAPTVDDLLGKKCTFTCDCCGGHELEAVYDASVVFKTNPKTFRVTSSGYIELDDESGDTDKIIETNVFDIIGYRCASCGRDAIDPNVSSFIESELISVAKDDVQED